jgi:hypothetical protein
VGYACSVRREPGLSLSQILDIFFFLTVTARPSDLFSAQEPVIYLLFDTNHPLNMNARISGIYTIFKREVQPSHGSIFVMIATASQTQCAREKYLAVTPPQKQIG